VVGFKPTVGLVSRTHIVPISHSQDTAGPIATTVEDAAIVLTAIAGRDPAGPGDRRGRRAQGRLSRRRWTPTR
jgi:amidase